MGQTGCQCAGSIELLNSPFMVGEQDFYDPGLVAALGPVAGHE